MDAMQRTDGRRKRLAAGGCLALALLLLLLLVIGARAAVFSETTDKQTQNGNVTIDTGNKDQGYFLIKHAGSKKRLKVLVTAPNGVKAQYDLNGNGEFEPFSFPYGNGSYKVAVLQNIEKNRYAYVYSTTLHVNMPDPSLAFLCPNQYVMYTPLSAAVAKSYELCEGLTDDGEKARRIYEYVSTHVLYDYIKAMTVAQRTGYLPNVDETLLTGMGVCFDYAALLACMLRVQGIPAKHVIGTLLPTNQYHAWNIALIDGAEVLMDATFPSIDYKESDYLAERIY